MRINPILFHLNAVLEKVREDHPFRGQRPGFISTSLIDEVKEKLDACEFKNLYELAYSFNTKQILCCLELLVHDRDDEIILKAGEILKLRPRDQLILRGWLKLVQYYPNDLLEHILRKIIGERGFALLEDSKRVSSNISNWFISYTLQEGILRDYQNSNSEKNFDIYLKDNLLKDKDGLFKVSWRTMLTKGNPRSIKKEKTERILLEYIKAENAPYLQSFGQHYLNILKKRENWEERILVFIADKYGAPKAIDTRSDIETPFWRKVHIEAKSEFNTWYILRSIDKFFEGVRADFWKKYVEINKVERVKEILDGDGFMLDFGMFGVVEFKHIGNAAYIYSKRDFENYWANAEYRNQPSWFKDRNRAIGHRSFPGWDGRIIHKRDWQFDTSIKIDRLLGK